MAEQQRNSEIKEDNAGNEFLFESRKLNLDSKPNELS